MSTKRLFCALYGISKTIGPFSQIGAKGGAGEWDYDREELEGILADLTQFTTYAVAEMLDRFWSSDLNDGRTPRQRLIDCGARVS